MSKNESDNYGNEREENPVSDRSKMDFTEELFQLKDILSCMYYFQEEFDKVIKRVKDKIHTLEK